MVQWPCRKYRFLCHFKASRSFSFCRHALVQSKNQTMENGEKGKKVKKIMLLCNNVYIYLVSRTCTENGIWSCTSLNPRHFRVLSFQSIFMCKKIIAIELVIVTSVCMQPWRVYKQKTTKLRRDTIHIDVGLV